MNKREINRRVNSIKKGLIAIGFSVESHNENSFFKHFHFGFLHRKGYDVYVTYFDGWIIKVVDLEDEKDGRNVISGSLSFNNERDNIQFFDSLFQQILFKIYVKGRTDLNNSYKQGLNKLIGDLH